MAFGFDPTTLRYLRGQAWIQSRPVRHGKSIGRNFCQDGAAPACAAGFGGVLRCRAAARIIAENVIREDPGMACSAPAHRCLVPAIAGVLMSALIAVTAVAQTFPS